MKYKVHRARFVEYVPQAIHCFAFEDLKDPARAALSRADGSIEIWNVSSDWHQELIIPGCNGTSVEALDWCRDRLFTAGLHAEVTEWDLDTVQPKVSSNSFGGAVWCLKVNHARTHLAAGCEDGRVRLFDIAPCGLSYDRSLNQEEGRVLSLSWHPSDKTLVTGGSDSTVRVYSVSSGQCTLRITMDEFHTRSTLTWAIHITSDYVIITGNSLGSTQFWDGKQGTLIQCFRAHGADVLALCVNKEENMVFSGGVDSKLVQFQLITNKDGVSNWVRGGSMRTYSQDVRTLATLGGKKNLLFSGGLDTCVTVYSTKQFGRSSFRVRQIASFPHSPMIFMAPEANVLMYQMSGGLQFWRLGETDAESTTIIKPPAQLLRINKKGDHHILCSAISACGAWAVFSDAYQMSLFKLNMAAEEPSKVTVSKVSSLPEDLSPARKLVFTPDSSKLICGGSHGTIQVLDLTGEPVLSHSFNIPGSNNHGLTAVCLLAVSCDGRWLACADRSNTVNILNLRKAKHHNTLPKLESRLTAMAFQPNTNHLAVVCCSHQIYMFNTKTGKLTDWSRQACEHGLPKQWLQRYCKVINIQFSPACHEIMLLQDHDMFALLDLREPLPSTDVVLYESRLQTRKRKQVTSNEQIPTGNEQQALRVCRKYVPLLHAGFTKDSSLVVVERPWASILETLPPTLERKRFAT